MQNITSMVEGLQPKLEKLLHLHEQLKNDNKRLKEANAEMNRRLAEKDSVIVELEEKYKVLKMARAVPANQGNNLDLKLKINELVREIDKCIAQLNR